MPNLKNSQKSHVNKQAGFIPLVVLVVVSVISASGITVVASQGSIPGDTLYPVKGVVENAKVAAAFSERDKAKVHLAIAEEKVREIEKLEERGRTDKIPKTAQSLKGSQGKALELTQAARSHGQNVDELVSLLEAQRGKQQTALTKVSQKVPEQVRQALLMFLEEYSEAFKKANETIEANGQEEADDNQSSSPSPTPCPSPDSSPSVENNGGYSSGILSQLRNMLFAQYSNNPCDSETERSSGAGSTTFEGGTESDESPIDSASDRGDDSTDSSYSEPAPQPSPP